MLDLFIFDKEIELFEVLIFVFIFYFLGVVLRNVGEVVGSDELVMFRVLKMIIIYVEMRKIKLGNFVSIKL